jgi:hypothetical protein
MPEKETTDRPSEHDEAHKVKRTTSRQAASDIQFTQSRFRIS